MLPGRLGTLTLMGACLHMCRSANQHGNVEGVECPWLCGRGRVVLRTERDWERSLEPVEVSEDGNISTFMLEADQPFIETLQRRLAAAR